MEKLIMPIKAKHFEDSSYLSNGNCSIANAAKEFFGTDYTDEGVTVLIIGNRASAVQYVHKRYGSDAYEEDYVKAVAASFDETIIREIELLMVK